MSLLLRDRDSVLYLNVKQLAKWDPLILLQYKLNRTKYQRQNEFQLFPKE